MGFTLYVVLYGLLALPDNGLGRDIYLVDAYGQEPPASCQQHYPFVAAISKTCSSPHNCIQADLCSGWSPQPCTDLTFIQAPLQNQSKVRLSAKINGSFIDLSSGKNEEGDLSKIWPLSLHLNTASVDSFHVAAHLPLGGGKLRPCSLSYLSSFAGQFKVATFQKLYFSSSHVPFHRSELMESAVWSRRLDNAVSLRVSIGTKHFDLAPGTCIDDSSKDCLYLYFANPSNRFPYHHSCVQSLEFDAIHFGHYFKLFDRSATTTPKATSSTRITQEVFFCDELKGVLIPTVPDIDQRCLIDDLVQLCGPALVNVTDRPACPIVQ